MTGGTLDLSPAIHLSFLGLKQPSTVKKDSSENSLIKPEFLLQILFSLFTLMTGLLRSSQLGGADVL